MIPKWEEVEVWLAKVGIPGRWHKWIARVVVVVAGMALLWRLLETTVTPNAEKNRDGAKISQQAGNVSSQIGNVQGDVNIYNQMPVSPTPSYRQPPHAPLESTSGNVPQPSIDGGNNVPCENPGNFNPKDDTHQREAWSLLEKRLAEMSRVKKNSINMRLIEEARRDWDKDHTSEALLKFRVALGCKSVLETNRGG